MAVCPGSRGDRTGLMAVAFDFNRVPGPGAREIKDADGQGALVYGTGAQQDPDYIAGLEAAGLHVVRIWEHNTDSILGGYHYGVSECQAWEAAHPPGLVYLACDLNDGALAGRSVVPFCNGWCDTTREPTAGLYGPDHAILDGIAMNRPKLSRWWGVVNWLDPNTGYAGPDNDPRNIERWTQIGAHIVQLIGSPIPDTDQNLILRDDWWTTGTPTPPPKKRGHEMELLISPTRALSHTAGVLDAQFPDPTVRYNDIPTSASGFLTANPGAQVSHVGEETYDRVLAKITAPPSAPGSGPTHFTGTVDLHGV